MRTIILGFFVTGAFGLAWAGQDAVYESKPGVEELSGRMIVRPLQDLAGPVGAKGDPGMMLSRQLVLAQIGPYVLRRLAMTDDFVVNVPDGFDETSYASLLMDTGLYQYAEPDWIVYPCATPNDPFFSQQWHHTQIGSQRAWDFTSSLGNDANVIVAFTDTGVKTTHPDLAPNLVSGYDAVTQTAQADGGNVEDVLGHGTSIAGIIGAKGNNGIGVSGVGWNLKLMPIRLAEDPNGGGAAPITRILDGMQWAATHGAKVVNTSYSGVSNASVQTTAAAIRALGAISVWGAGNTNTALDSFDWPDVIIVGGTDQNDEKWTGSNYGVAVDLMAPCVGIYTTRRSAANPYGVNPPGTSWSAAVVSGAVGLLRAAFPSESLNRIEWRLLRFCKDLGAEGDPRASDYKAGNDNVFGFGRVSCSNAIEVHELRFNARLLPNDVLLENVDKMWINNFGSVAGSDHSVRWLWRPGNEFLDDLTQTWFSLAGILESSEVGGDQTYLLGEIKTQETGWALSPAIGDGATWLPVDLFNTYGTDTFASASNRHRLVAIRAYGHVALWNASSNTGIDLSGLIGGVSSRAVAVADNGSVLVLREPNPGFGDIVIYRSGSIFPVAVPYSTNDIEPIDMNEAEFVVGSYVIGSTRSAFATEATTGKTSTLQSLAGATESYPNATNGWQATLGRSGNVDVLWDHPHGESVAMPISSLIDSSAGLYDLRCYNINDKNQICGLGKLSEQEQRLFVLDPIRNDNQSNYDLGQVGSGPIIGTILPNTLKLDFLSADGSAVLTSQRVDYNKIDGSLRYPVPAELNGESYRVYVRPCDEDYIASSQELGPGYLGKLYPPLGEGSQPLPPDTTYIEMQELTRGDIDYDNEVNIVDFGILSFAFGSTYGDSNYDSRANLDGDLDNEITIVDFGILAASFGQTGDEDPTP